MIHSHPDPCQIRNTPGLRGSPCDVSTDYSLQVTVLSGLLYVSPAS